MIEPTSSWQKENGATSIPETKSFTTPQKNSFPGLNGLGITETTRSTQPDEQNWRT
jgi:hypothetical protein